MVDVLTQQYRQLLENDPENFVPVNLMGGDKVPNMRFGIYCEALIRAGHDLAERVLNPLLEHLPGLPVSERVGLVQAFFRSCAMTTDTFSRRADAQHSWLGMLKHFTTDLEGMAGLLEINVETYRQWLAEAFAIISVGYAFSRDSRQPVHPVPQCLQDRRYDRTTARCHSRCFTAIG